MKKISYAFVAALIMFAFSCSKDKDPAAFKCSFKFNNITYKTNVAVCYTDGDYRDIVAENDSEEWDLTVTTFETIIFDDYGNQKNWEGYNAELTITNDTFTFSGTLTDGETDKAISGKCTCTEFVD
jgi:hypothetical protein